MVLNQILPHADVLGPLSGEDEGCFCHLSLSQRFLRSISQEPNPR